MNINEDKDTWFGKLADSLRDHHEPYQEGAWERFEQKFAEDLNPGHEMPVISAPLKKKQAFRWVWASGIAAAILLLLGVFVIQRDSLNDAPVQVTATEPKAILPDHPSVEVDQVDFEDRIDLGAEGVASIILPSTQLVSAVDRAMAIDLNEPQRDLPKYDHAGFVLPQAESALQSQALTALPVSSQTIQAPSKEDPYAWLNNPNQLAVNEAPASLIEEVKLSEDWDLGVSLVSAMTSQRVNMAGGLAVTYKLTDRLSISSGVTLGKFDVQGGGTQYAGVNIEKFPMYNSSLVGGAGSLAESEPVRYNRQLKSSTSDLLTMDIPVDLKVAISKRFYTSVGVSFLGVLDEVRTNHYVDQINEPIFNGGTSAGQDFKKGLQALYVSERSANNPLTGNGYAGFLNFSVGHRTSLSKSIKLSIEPFFKLPVGKLAREDVNMTNGGIRIVTGF